MVARKRQVRCIFCSLLSPSVPKQQSVRTYALGYAPRFRSGGLDRHYDFSKDAKSTNSRFWKSDPQFKREESGKWKDQEGSGAAHVKFSPSIGETFNRNRPKTSTYSPFHPKHRAKSQSWPGTRSKGDVAHKITGQIIQLETRLSEEPILKTLNVSDETLIGHFRAYKKKVLEALDQEDVPDPPFLKRLQDAWLQKSVSGLDLELKYSFFGDVVASRFSPSDVKDQERLANLRYPQEWFPGTRAFQREFHLHIGPTNSGKTYHALKRLEEAKTGLYAGPLRLLAHEVYMRLNASGKRCSLITGDERRGANDGLEAPMVSSTVEMIPLNVALDVAVIDEIQLIGSEDRGWAWTQAVLGVMAREVHLCGEERSLPIIRELVALCGEKLHVHRYSRLSPLKMMSRSLDGNLRNLQKGDCVVAFSVMIIHGLRQAIERVLNCKVAIIYGSLPPETRAQQARLFNDPNNDYDILVASNAVGMGLNLSIKRLVFQSSERNIGGERTLHSIAEIKQIAGRAGRYSTAEQDMTKNNGNESHAVAQPADQITSPIAPPKSTGLVTTLEKVDFPIIEKAMKSEAEPITSAGILPPSSIVERFARYFPPGTPFSYVLVRLHELSLMSSRFHLCDVRQQVSIADAIEPVEGLTASDKIVFCSAPIEPRKQGEPELARAYARFVAQSRAVSIADVDELNLELLEDDYVADRAYLRKLEELHKGVIVFMWLSYRFAGVFIQRELALHVKQLVETRIEAVLEKLAFDFEKMRLSREQRIISMLAEEAAGHNDTPGDVEVHGDGKIGRSDTQEVHDEEPPAQQRAINLS